MGVKVKTNFNFKDIEKQILKEAKTQMSSEKFDFKCPDCGKKISAHAGKSICPHCGEEVNLTLDFKF
jgi:Zn finger protein HypA/HybF involved in hydrogenase expression